MDNEPEPVWKWTVKQYHRLINEGILTEDDPVELIAGRIVVKSCKSPGHTFGKRRLKLMLKKMLPPSYWISEQDPVTLRDSEPEPDIAVVAGREADFSVRHPKAAKVPLIIEVADSTLERDREDKLPVYAAAGIQQYWILNLIDHTVEVHSRANRQQATYRNLATYDEAASVPVIIAGKVVGKIKVADVLPKKKS